MNEWKKEWEIGIWKREINYVMFVLFFVSGNFSGAVVHECDDEGCWIMNQKKEEDEEKQN